MKERNLAPWAADALHFLIKTLVRLLGLIPGKSLPGLARRIGAFWYRIDKRHRDITRDNLQQAYAGALNHREVDALAREVFIHLSGVALELPRLLKVNRDNLHQFAVCSGLKHAREALSQDKGVVFLTAHYGNWELLALAANLMLGVPIHVMARPLDLEPADRVLTHMRSHTGNVVLDKDKSAGSVAGLLKARKAVGILLDQNASWYEGVYVPFFGRICCTNKGLAIFALRHGAAVVPVFSRRRPDGRYDVEFLPALEMIRTGNIGKDVEANTALFNNVMETQIRKAPEQWLWVHRRWRIKNIPERARKKMGGLPEV